MVLGRPQHRGLCGFRAGGPCEGSRWWLTPAGRALRAAGLDPLGG